MRNYREILFLKRGDGGWVFGHEGEVDLSTDDGFQTAASAGEAHDFNVETDFLEQIFFQGNGDLRALQATAGRGLAKNELARIGCSCGSCRKQEC